jgi:hypothetical protein
MLRFHTRKIGVGMTLSTLLALVIMHATIAPKPV